MAQMHQLYLSTLGLLFNILTWVPNVSCQLQTTAGLNITTTTMGTTLPPDPGALMLIIVPVCILAGIPLTIAIYCCLSSMIGCAKKGSRAYDNRRITPINNGEPDFEGAGDGKTKIHNTAILQDGIITYDEVNEGDRKDDGYEQTTGYNVGWEF